MSNANSASTATLSFCAHEAWWVVMALMPFGTWICPGVWNAPGVSHGPLGVWNGPGVCQPASAAPPREPGGALGPDDGGGERRGRRGDEERASHPALSCGQRA